MAAPPTERWTTGKWAVDAIQVTILSPGIEPPANGYACRAALQSDPDNWHMWQWHGGLLREPEWGFAPGTYNVQCAWQVGDTFDAQGYVLTYGEIQTWSESKTVVLDGS